MAATGLADRSGFVQASWGADDDANDVRALDPQRVSSLSRACYPPATHAPPALRRRVGTGVDVAVAGVVVRPRLRRHHRRRAARTGAPRGHRRRALVEDAGEPRGPL